LHGEKETGKMQIQNNITALNASRQLNIVHRLNETNMERLSTGYRINRAADDAAGLAISEKMRNQIRGLNQASINVENGIRLVQTAEGAMQEVSEILLRMRTLSIQSANDTNTEQDRTNLQDEVEQLLKEINRIGTDTEFNTLKILQGDKAIIRERKVEILPSYNLVTVSKVDGFDDKKVFNPTAIIKAQDSTLITPTLPNLLTCSKTLDFSRVTNSNKKELLNAGFSFGCSQNCSQSFEFTFVNSVSVPGDSPYAAEGKKYGILDLTPNVKVSSGGAKKFEIALNSFSDGEELVSNLFNYVMEMNKTDGVTTVDGGGYTIYSVGHANYLFGNGAKLIVAGNGSNAKKNDSSRNYELFNAEKISDIRIDPERISADVIIQAGANKGQIIILDLPQVDTNTMKINNVDISTREGASSAILQISKSIDYINKERSRLGAYQNRMEHTIASLDNASENLSASESRIRDADMAQEMLMNTRNEILRQTSSSMLAQANQLTEGVLELLQ